MQKINFQNLPNQTTPISAQNLNAMQDNAENAIKEVTNVELLAVTNTPPIECSIGDKYYNTTTKKIYIATDTDTWSITGEDPISGIFYIVFDDGTTYSWDGTDLVSVGGGSTSSGIIALKTIETAPSTFIKGDKYYDANDDLIYTALNSSSWDTGEIPSTTSLYLNEVDNKLYRYYNNAMNAENGATLSDQYGTSTTDGYTQRYINANIPLMKDEYGSSLLDGYSQDYINNNISGTILWTNPNPSNAISTENITVADMSNYDVIEVWFRQYRTTPNQHYTAKVIKGDQIYLVYNGVGLFQGSYYYLTRARSLTPINDTTIEIGLGYQNNNGTITQENNVAIPEYIVGYKTGLFS